jgi:hypothetical protein
MSKRPLYIVFIGLILIIAMIMVYLYLKFNYYEKELKSKIIIHNQLLSEYFDNYLKLDSIESSRFDKYDFYYLSDNIKLKKDLRINYEKHLDWLKNRINKIRLLNDEMKRLIMKNQVNQISSQELKGLMIQDSKYDSIKKERRKKFYTHEDLMNLYDEKVKQTNEIFNRKEKK